MANIGHLNKVITDLLDSQYNWNVLIDVLSDPTEMTPANNDTINTTYGIPEQNVIINLRARVAELEETVKKLNLAK